MGWMFPYEDTLKLIRIVFIFAESGLFSTRGFLRKRKNGLVGLTARAETFQQIHLNDFSSSPTRTPVFLPEILAI